MDKNIKEIIHKYWKKKITIHQFKEKISNIIGNRKKDIRNFIEEIMFTRFAHSMCVSLYQGLFPYKVHF